MINGPVKSSKRRLICLKCLKYTRFSFGQIVSDAMSNNRKHGKLNKNKHDKVFIYLFTTDSQHNTYTCSRYKYIKALHISHFQAHSMLVTSSFILK